MRCGKRGGLSWECTCVFVAVERGLGEIMESWHFGRRVSLVADGVRADVNADVTHADNAPQGLFASSTLFVTWLPYPLLLTDP